jgi:hypothetical protein
MPEVSLTDKILFEYLKDPRVVSAAALSALVYYRAQDVHSGIGKFTAYIRKQQGLDAEDVGLNAFWKAVVFLGAGPLGFAAAALKDEAMTRVEIARIEGIYKEKLDAYTTEKATMAALRAIPEPVKPILLTLRDWFQGDFNALSFEQQVQATQDHNAYARSIREQLVVWQRKYDRWIEGQSWQDPGPPPVPPALALWYDKVTVSRKDAATYALIAFIIGMNPEIAAEGLKGVGEIIKGIGEIVPL